MYVSALLPVVGVLLSYLFRWSRINFFSLLNVGMAMTWGAIVALGIVGLITLVVAYKLQKGRSWARTLVLVLSVLGLLANLFLLVTQGMGALSLTGVAYCVAMLVLLNTKAARGWFRNKTY